MGNEWTERDRLVFEFTSILRCALPQSNRSAPPSVDKQKSPKCFLLSTGTESQQPNQCREAVHGCTFTSKETFSKFVSSSIAKYLLATPVFFYQFSHLIFSPVFLFVSRIATGRAILPCTIAQRTPIRALPISY